MVVKTFWLYVCAMMLYVDGKQNNYLQLLPVMSRNKVCCIAMPTIATLAMFCFFGYSFIQKRLNNKLSFLNKDEIRSIILCENAIQKILFLLKLLPKDLQQYIHNINIIKEKKEMHEQNFSKEIVTYSMSLAMYSPEGLLYPINLHANSLVRQTFVGQTNPNDLLPRNGDRCFIDTQWWVGKSDKIVRLSIDTIAANCYINCILPKELVIDDMITLTMSSFDDGAQVVCRNDFKEHFMMDGKNVNNCVVIGAISSNKKTSAIFADKIYVQYGQGTNAQMQPYAILNGLLLTVMMHPYKHIIAYSFKQERPDQDIKKVPQYEIHIVENVCCAPEGNMIELSSSPMDYYSSVDFGIKKITFFGGSTYLFLTVGGQLGMCWSATDKQNKNIVQWSLKEHKSTYIDFTPDTSVVTSTGFMPNWAFLNDEGEIFWCDFLLQLNTRALFFVKQATPPKNLMDETFDKIYYKDGHCGVLYKTTNSFRKDVPHTKLILYS